MFNQYRRSHFAPAFFFLSRERREALQCLYAVCRMLDDAVDIPNQKPELLLAAWKDVLISKNSYLLKPFGQELLADQFIAVMKIYDIPVFSILDLIDKGVSVDLRQSRFQTPLDLEDYCYGVAGTVGVACLPIFGVPWEQAKNFAVRLGIAIQWTNIVRDVGVDAKMGRLYLPLDHLEKFQCSEREILENNPTQAFSELMSFEVSVAKSHYKRAMELLPDVWRKNLLPARIMAKIYSNLLEKIERQSYPVLEKRISLNIFEKGYATFEALRQN